MWGQKQSAMITEVMLTQLLVSLNKDDVEISSEIPETLFVSCSGIFEHHMPAYSIKFMESKGKQYFDKEYVSMLFKSVDKHINNYYSFCKKVRNTNLSELTDSELKDVLIKYHNYLKRTFIYFSFSNPFWTHLLVKDIKKILKNKLLDNKLVEEYFISLSSPADLDETMKERIDFLNIMKNDSVSDEELVNYSMKYPALFFNTYDEDQIMQFLNERLKERKTKNEIDYEIKKMKMNVLSIKNRHTEIYSQFNDENLESYAKILQRVGLDRYRLKHTWSGGEYLCLNLIRELHSRVGGDFLDFIRCYTFSDLYNFLDGKGELSENELEDRRKCIVFHYFDDSIHKYYGDEGIQYKDKLIEQKEVAVSKKIKGVIANRGMVKGKARVVNVGDLKQFTDDCKAFVDGEILVTTMTSPVMVPIVEKAAAIVADEGGICSHAAVVSREFKIPCIVGTSDACTIIKTGDLIEVDAINGIVRKLT